MFDVDAYMKASLKGSMERQAKVQAWLKTQKAQVMCGDCLVPLVECGCK